ncbi:MAG: NADPH:quinone oxidoreductase family protein [Verrucomicrobiota bacterium]
MKAYLCNEYGSPAMLELAQVETDQVGDRQVRIETHFIGVNFADVMAIAGVHQFPPPKPFSPGFEASGIIREIGTEVTHLAVGDRVMFTDGYGAYREEIVASQDHVFKIPDTLTLAQAAALPVAFGTPYFALTRRAPLSHGDHLLVVGAAGNIGSSAVQIGKLLGARVIAIVGTNDVEKAKALGADLVIDYRSEDIAERISSETDGRGVDVAFDPVIGPDFDKVKDSIAAEGSLLVMGLAGGDLARLPSIGVLEPLQRNISFLSADFDYYLHEDIAAVHKAFETMMAWIERGWIKPITPTETPFEDGVSVLTGLAEKTLRGKQALRTAKA